jgi:hypothetical protein
MSEQCYVQHFNSKRQRIFMCAFSLLLWLQITPLGRFQNMLHMYRYSLCWCRLRYGQMAEIRLLSPLENQRQANFSSKAIIAQLFSH